MTYMTEMMRDAMRPKPKKPAAPVLLDSANDLPVLTGADDFTMKDIALAAVATIQQWAETDASELDEGESMADRLMFLMVGIADANKDGEITEDEQGVLDIALNAAWDYLSSLGVTDEDAGALLNDWDADTGDRVKELVAAALPDGEAEAAAAMDAFVFGDDQEPMLDAAYKKVVAFRAGKKVRISKRISGTVRLSGKQKLAIRKMQMKSHSAVARMHRMKTMSVRRKSGR